MKRFILGLVCVVLLGAAIGVIFYHPSVVVRIMGVILSSLTGVSMALIFCRKKKNGDKKNKD